MGINDDELKMDSYSIYDTILGEKQLVLSAPTEDEAMYAFDLLRAKITKYANATIEWQYTFMDDEIAVGEVVR